MHRQTFKAASFQRTIKTLKPRGIFGFVISRSHAVRICISPHSWRRTSPFFHNSLVVACIRRCREMLRLASIFLLSGLHTTHNAVTWHAFGKFLNSRLNLINWKRFCELHLFPSCSGQMHCVNLRSFPNRCHCHVGWNSLELSLRWTTLQIWVFFEAIYFDRLSETSSSRNLSLL